ncbi:MAG: DUF433 domain-containing protein [Verrucomicrobia bacterium]|nr:DUF433 domain-containing protein [Verrucomicrobiota bacterium]
MTLPERIAIDSEIRVDKPCVKGTRLAVCVLSQKMARGESEAELLQAYPQLEKRSLVCDRALNI